ncbi:MAG: hypothetical protein M1143_02025 [Candidatus Thermoplasmatota archaeon]|jgi:hypothetical protein|nr:hypothetical protein [Candidatus Thermoplasmatota archaeon]
MSSDDTRFKEHLAELRNAAKGLGGDIESELRGLEREIEKLPGAVEKDVERMSEDIEYGLLRTALKIQKELKTIPGKVSGGAKTFARDSVKLARAAKVEARHTQKVVKHDVKAGFARAAGVETRPISEWKRPKKEEKS